MWKSLMAKIHTYRDRPSGLKREGSPIPCVELFDIQGESTVDVAEELCYTCQEESSEMVASRGKTQIPLSV
ncbi:hypothetical protein RUM44_005359 [Polyplax serrata]|uniref:Uncharacterized protein n=1 Tax=Polyplax serrata TaxID=468196 RepID=A0ABR1ADB4_POLSC